MAQYAREPRAYELMTILLPDLAEEDLTGAVDRVSGYITDGTGAIKEVLSDSPWGRRRLAYPIRFNSHDYRDGIYVIWHFDLEPSRMAEIERELKLDTRVIRYLIVLDDPKWGSPNEGNQPPTGEADAGDRRPSYGERRPTGERRPYGERRPAPAPVAPAVEAESAAPETATEDPAATPAETMVAASDTVETTSETIATPVETVASADDDVAVTTDEFVATTDEAVIGAEIAGPSGEVVETEPIPETAASTAPVTGASGEENTAVVDDAMGAVADATSTESAPPAEIDSDTPEADDKN